MRSSEIRQKFFEFFEGKGHKIVPSAPIVVKNDPTLMFTNAGMNQFKDFFLGNAEPSNVRVADTQKCLRVSGKHNDLEEVGRDSYHHTMFEMLGNWSFGDYFKKEAIAWAWELLIEVYGLDPERLYITVFEGDEKEKLEADEESVDIWNEFVPKERILYFDRKDNFWEMGDTGPCGPCSEIHVDLRSDIERAKTPAQDLVNMDHPQVVEIWNLVFIQFNRKANGSLENLPSKHVDTGMGFERLVMAMQGKTSNYDTDVFSAFIEKIEATTGIKYTSKYDESSMTDIAMRVIVDHVRAVSFTIADGELPSNTGAGYVIRRILRRAVRYYYSFLDIKEPFIHSLVPLLAERFAKVFPELDKQKDFVKKVILEEEKSFLNTLSVGLKRIDQIEVREDLLDGNLAFELYDTYGFPIDLTMLIAEEKGWKVDIPGFQAALNAQKSRGRADAQRETGDWTELLDLKEVHFTGYDHLTEEGVRIIKHRIIKEKGKEIYQLVLDKTPFYAEGGGQVGDAGLLSFGDETIKVITTKKENDLIIHFVNKFPENLSLPALAKVDAKKRKLTENNHSATHLMHAALRDVLGDHVQQKGSLVKDASLRFDFSHFQKLTAEEIHQVETIVNQRIRENIVLKEDRNIAIDDAKSAGAMMLFGEKYGETVRMITFNEDFSIELCGGCHVPATGHIGLFKIKSESAIAAGVRRIEAITSEAAEAFVNEEISTLNAVRSQFKNQKDIVAQIAQLHEQNKNLQKELEKFQVEKAMQLKTELIEKCKEQNGIKYIAERINLPDAKLVKTLLFNLEKELGEVLIVAGFEAKGKANLMVMASKSLTENKDIHAGNIIKQIASHINGGGGGQASFASAGGTKLDGIDEALKAVKNQF